jgi:hypothetical protein
MPSKYLTNNVFFLFCVLLTGAHSIASPPILLQIKAVNEADTIKAGGSIAIEALVSDSGKSFQYIDFYQGTSLLGTDSTFPFQYVIAEIESGEFSFYALGKDTSIHPVLSDTASLSIRGCISTGMISRQVYNDIGGARVEILKESTRFPIYHSYVTRPSIFEGDENIGNKYGSRLSGYLCPTVTGQYVFHIAADDRAELNLSTDDDANNKMLIAKVDTPVKPREFKKYDSQTSAPFKLIKGKKYFIEAIHKEDINSDHISVAWTMPGNVFQGPISGDYLSALRDGPVGVEEADIALSERLLELYPNPARGSLTIKYQSQTGGATKVSLLDVSSHQVVMSMGANSVQGENRFTLSLANKPAGLYLLQVQDGDRNLYKKLVIEQ